MAIVNQPTPLSNELAWNGDKNPIPDTNDCSKGLFSVEYGFPYVTQQPLAQGGIPPQRNDFNGVLNLLSKFIRYFQNGGVFAYNASMDYSVGMLVRSGDRLYVCKAENGANTTAGVQDVSNSNYWNEITLEDTLDNTLVNQLKTVLVTEAKTAGNTTDWNNLTESRTYKISGATFSSTYHQPVGASGNGELVVLKNGTDTIVQVYYANSVQASQAGAFHRIYFNGTWTEWVYDITNKGGKIDGSLTLSGDLTADNITANGDLSVTGNSTINGKLTVDSLDIQNNFTVAGGTPVTGDDLQKVQDQIIAPSQYIYVDQKNGNDNNDGSDWSKAVMTLDKAVSMIKKDVKEIHINLMSYETGNPTYFLSSPIISSSSAKIYLYGNEDNYLKNKTKAIVKIGRGKISAGYGYEGGERVNYYWYGNIFLYGFSSASIGYLSISFDEDLTNDKDNTYLNCLFFNVIFSLFACDFNIPKYCALAYIRNNTDYSFSIPFLTTLTGDGYILRGNVPNYVSKDPSSNTQNLLIETRNATFQRVSSILVSGLIIDNNNNIADTILSNGTSGIDSGVAVIYKSWN